jgi:hypothetical protein
VVVVLKCKSKLVNLDEVTDAIIDKYLYDIFIRFAKSTRTITNFKLPSRRTTEK